MDASRLTRLRREQASQILSTRVVKEASQHTREIKLKNSGVLKQIKGTNQNCCDGSTVLAGGGVVQSIGGSYDAILLKNVVSTECCATEKADKIRLPVDCYVAEPNPTLTTRTRPCFIGQ